MASRIHRLIPLSDEDRARFLPDGVCLTAGRAWTCACRSGWVTVSDDPGDAFAVHAGTSSVHAGSPGVAGRSCRRVTPKGTRPHVSSRRAVYRPTWWAHLALPAQRLALEVPDGERARACSCGEVRTGSRAELDAWWARHRLDLPEPRVRVPRHVAVLGAVLRVVTLTWLWRYGDATEAVQEAPGAAEPDTDPSVDPVLERAVEPVSCERRRALLSAWLALGCLPAVRRAMRPRAMTAHDHDGELLELITGSWRGGRPGFVSVRDGKWYPTISGAAGLDRYWVGGSATWDATVGTKWAATDGGAGGASVPDAGDRVHLTALSGAVTVTTGGSGVSLCRSLDCTGFTGTMALSNSTSALGIGDASGGALTLSAGMTLTIGGASTNFQFNSNSTNGGVGWGVTTAGKTMPGVVFATTGGKWVLQDALTATAGTATITLTAGTLDTNGQSVTAGTFSSTNANVRTLILGTSSVTLTGTGNAWNIATATNFTLSAASSTITLSGANVAMQASPTAGGSYGTVAFTGSGIPALSGAAATFVNLTRTGTAAKTDTIQFVFNTVVTGTLTFNSNSSVNRLLVQSNTPGLARTITAAAVVMSNVVDFMDITGAGAATWTTGATGATFLGDCGGNSGITFTTPATQTHTASSGGNWSDVTKWTSRVPLPQDNVVVDVNTTGTLAADMPRLGASIDFTGFAGTWNSNFDIFGSLTLVAGMTLGTSGGFGFKGRGAHTVTSAGKAFGSTVTFQGPGGSYTLQDALSTTGALNVNDGTFTTNNQSVTCANFFAVSGRATTVNFGTTTLTLTQATVGTVLNVDTSSTTSNMTTATVVIAAASTVQRIVVGKNAGTAIGTLTYNVANSPGALLLGNASGRTTTFGTLNVGSGRGLTVFSGHTVNVTNWNVNGTSNGYLYLPGVAGNDVSTPDSAAVSITGDQEYIVRASIDALVPTTNTYLGGKWQGIAGGEAWRWGVNTTGALVFVDSTDGTNTVYNSAMASTAQMAAAITAGVTFWWRLTIQTNSGGKRVVTAYYAPDNVAVPTVWTALGGVLNTVAAANYIDTTGPFEIGGFQGGTQPWQGRMYRAILRNGIGGTVALDVDLTRNLGTAGWLDAAKTQFTESSVNAATVTINGALALAGDGRVLVTSSTPGTAATVAKVAGTAAVMADYLSVQDSTATGGLWVDGPHYANVSGNTGWTFADALPSGTENGTGADASSLTVTLTGTDTGAGVESSKVGVSGVDVGAGVETGVTAASLSGTDAGSGVETGTVAAALTVTDNGTGVEVSSLAAALSVIEAGTGVDASSLTVTLTALEVGLGLEVGTLAVALAVTDNGHGVDAGAAIAARMIALAVTLGVQTRRSSLGVETRRATLGVEPGTVVPT